MTFLSFNLRIAVMSNVKVGLPLSREINNSMKRQGGMEDIGLLTLMIYFHCAELSSP